MVYKPPRYQDIQKETNSLRKNFTDFACLYLIPKTKQIVQYIDQIDQVYRQKVSGKSKKPDSKRLDQISLIKHVRDDLDSDLHSKDEGIRLEAERVAMGSAIYRFLQLRENYSPKLEANLKKISAFFASFAYYDVSNCELHNTLLELFNFKDLDSYTIWICCTSLWNFLNLDRCKGRYAYINSDPEFFDKLNHIIKVADTQIELTKNQMKLITYIESMGLVLSKSDQEVEHFLSRLNLLINQKLKALAKDAYLSRTEVLECLNTLNSNDQIKKIFEDFIPKELTISNNGDLLTPNEGGEWEIDGHFGKIFLKLLAVQSKFTLLGAYFLCLNKNREMNAIDVQKGVCSLQKALRKAIGITNLNSLEIEDNEDKNTLAVALEHLEKFMDREDITQVKFDIWGCEGPRQMRRELINLKESYQRQTEPGFLVM